MKPALTHWFPILDWGRRYSAAHFGADAVAAAVVTLMLIPQSLAYALLAGLPPEAGPCCLPWARCGWVLWPTF